MQQGISSKDAGGRAIDLMGYTEDVLAICRVPLEKSVAILDGSIEIMEYMIGRIDPLVKIDIKELLGPQVHALRASASGVRKNLP